MNLQFEVYQWLGPLIAIYFIFRTFRQYRNGKYSPRNTFIWIFFWLGIMLLSLLPDAIPNSIAKGLGFKDHVNALIFASLAILFIMVFYLSAAVNRIEDKMTNLVRIIALDQVSSTVSDPIVSDPIVSDPTVSDPTVSDPTVSDPTVSDPTVSDPTVSDPDSISEQQLQLDQK